MSTWAVCVSSERISSSMKLRFASVSRAMSTFVRSSTAMEPRGDSRSLARCWISSACA
jgi:hypothetical protein